ncbi:MAG: adenylosuccinate lyase [Duodenibacillus sp.]|nr:adenylosuccinate lyase [Duodenibacillus sp.]HBC69131.1 adenylosuccinate lyase [Sutterella sp.]
MTSTVIDSQIFGSLFSTDEMREVFSDRNWAQKWLDTEAALAAAQAELGVIPQEKADIINKYAKAELLDIPMIGEYYKSSITIVPLLKAFKAVLPDNAGEFVHWGATSQDIVDTGIVLLQRDAYNIILRDMKLCQQYCLDLAKKYRDTCMAGRTHVVHAIPITFGYKAAVWADELGRDIERLEGIYDRVFVGEMAGAVGTLASQPEHGLETQRRMFKILGLSVPTIAWHVARDNQAEFSQTLALCAGSLGRIIHEIFSLQHTEILELEEPFFMGKVGSSTMPHKRNPAVLENVLALLRSVRSCAPAIVETMISENERDWGCFITEWEAIPRQCLLMAGALEKSKNILKNLIVYPKHMERNLNAQKGLMMSECVMMHLAAKLGRLTAHEIVYKGCMEAYEKEIPLKEVLMRTPAVQEAFTEAEVDKMLDPHSYVGLAPEFVDRVVAKWSK